jgi:hypothetical protein
MVQRCCLSGLDTIQGNFRKCNYLEVYSWEGQLINDRNSNEKTPEPEGREKPCKPPSLGFESAFEVSALSSRKITGTQSACSLSTKNQ